MKGRVSMPTQEERLTELEQTMTEYRPVLQSMAYELTMVKGLIVNQVEITRQLKQDMAEMKARLGRIEEQLATILTLLKPS
jgi:protein subunit release factor A